jgi:hypothetical protein
MSTMGRRAAMVVGAAAAIGIAGAASAAAAVDFVPALGTPFAQSSSPQAIAVGDVDGDGRPDLISAETGGFMRVLLGNGSGGFTALGAPLSADSGATSIAIGDLDGDRRPDLAVANTGTDTVTVLLGNGSGGFSEAPSSPQPTGAGTAAVAMGDVNGDGHLDLVTADRDADDVGVLLGDGTGGFTPAAGSPFATGSGSAPGSVALGDVDGDGRLDVVTADSGNDSAAVLVGNGSGGFTPAAGSPFTTGGAPDAVALGDVNGDGHLDVATADTNDNPVTVLLGDGADGFASAPGSPFAVGTAVDAIAAADVNADGHPDLVTADGNANGVTVLAGDGAGHFAPVRVSPFPVGSHPVDVAVADLDGDGRPDLVTANGTAGGIGVLLNAGAATAAITGGPLAFAPQAASTLSAAQTITIASTGDAALRVARIAATGVDADDFLVSHDTCTGVAVGVGATCTVHVRFTPSGAGAKAATLTIADNAQGGGASVPLTGIGGALPTGPQGPGGAAGAAGAVATVPTTPAIPATPATPKPAVATTKPAVPAAKIACTTTTQKAAKTKKAAKAVSCKVTSTRAGQTISTATLRLARGTVTYATATLRHVTHTTTARLTPRRTLTPGRYTLHATLTTSTGTRATTTQTVTVR